MNLINHHDPIGLLYVCLSRDPGRSGLGVAWVINKRVACKTSREQKECNYRTTEQKENRTDRQCKSKNKLEKGLPYTTLNQLREANMHNPIHSFPCRSRHSNEV